MNCIHQLPKESEQSDQYCDLYTLLRRTNKQTDEKHSESADFAKSLNLRGEKLGKVGKSWEKLVKMEKSGKK